MQRWTNFGNHHVQHGFVSLASVHSGHHAPSARYALRASVFIVGLLAIVLLLIANAPKRSASPSVDRTQLVQQATAGEPSAQLLLGLAYRDGRYGLPRDPATARIWLRRAADAGNGYAASALGDLGGVGTERLHRLPAIAGSTPAADHPALWRLNGFVDTAYRLFERLDPAGQAADTLKRRATDGDAIAQFQLAMRYRDGAMGLDRDTQRELYWLRRSADRGNAVAMDALAAAYRAGSLGLQRDADLATQWSERSARLRNISGHAANERVAVAPIHHD